MEIVGLSISFVTLLISVFIFCYFRYLDGKHVSVLVIFREISVFSTARYNFQVDLGFVPVCNEENFIDSEEKHTKLDQLFIRLSYFLLT